jgi:hypothetical protein
LTELSYVKNVTSAIQTQFTGKAATGQTFYIGTTQVAINRTTGALAFTGITSIDGFSGNIRLVGSSTGYVTFSTPNAGATNYTLALPDANDTIAVLGTNQTFTAVQSFNQILNVVNPITASGNAATVPITYRSNKVTNNSAATITITMAVTNAVDGQLSMVRVIDASAAAQTITWVNTENSTVSAPILTTGVVNTPVTVGFIFNGATSLWRCIASI